MKKKAAETEIEITLPNSYSNFTALLFTSSSCYVQYYRLFIVKYKAIVLNRFANIFSSF